MNQAALCASSAPVASPTVLVIGLLDTVADDAALSDGLDIGSVTLPEVMPVDAWADDIRAEDIGTDDMGADDIAEVIADEGADDDAADDENVDAGAAVPLVELHPAISTAVPVITAIRVVRFMGELLRRRDPLTVGKQTCGER